jgi:hypothetical protein
MSDRGIIGRRAGYLARSGKVGDMRLSGGRGDVDSKELLASVELLP